MKSLLQPNWIRVILTLVLFGLSSWLWMMVVRLIISDTFPLGFPLQFFLSWGPCQAVEDCSEFNALWLLIDLVFWYFVSAVLTTRFQKK